MSQLPKVSVLLAVKDEETYVTQCLESLSRQGGVALEAVFVDDGSTDGTWGILQGAARRYPWLRALRNRDKGKVSAFNFAYESSSGDFVCMFAGDDIMVEDTLVQRVQPLLDPSVRGPAITVCKLKTFSETPRYDGHVIPRSSDRGVLSGQCMMFNRALAEMVFPVPPHLPNEDTWASIFVRFIDEVRLFHVPVVSCLYRIHEGNSMNRFVPYERYTQLMHARMIAYSDFLTRKGSLLNSSSRQRVEALARLEEHRHAGSPLAILLQPDVEIRDRMRAFFQSNRMVYALRNRLFGLFSGR